MAAHDNDAINTAMAPAGAATPATGPHKVVRFLREVRTELKKTSWPSRNELAKYTAVVMITIVAVAVYLSLADAVVGAITSKLYGITTSAGPRP
jgi:preprotein translocase subunit SecE